MVKQPKISIIIPVYNVAEYITECLQSVMRQTYKGEIECILVDDCGTDNSIAVAEKLLADYKGAISFRILRHAHNRGLSAARNTGTDAATGDYIYYLDSDDYISDDCLEVLTEPLKKKEYDMVVGNYTIVGRNADVPQIQLERDQEITGADFILKCAKSEMIITAWNKLYKFAFLRSNHIHFIEGLIHEDNPFNFECSLYEPSVYVIIKSTYFYRIRIGSIMDEAWHNKMIINWEKVYETICFSASKTPYRYELDVFIMHIQGEISSTEANSRFYSYKRHLYFRKYYPYRIWRLYKKRKISASILKKRMSYVLPPPMGFLWMKLKWYKNSK